MLSSTATPSTWTLDELFESFAAAVQGADDCDVSSFMSEPTEAQREAQAIAAAIADHIAGQAQLATSQLTASLVRFDPNWLTVADVENLCGLLTATAGLLANNAAKAHGGPESYAFVEVFANRAVKWRDMRIAELYPDQGA